MVNLVFTNQGWFIFEPQTGDFIFIGRLSESRIRSIYDSLIV